MRQLCVSRTSFVGRDAHDVDHVLSGSTIGQKCEGMNSNLIGSQYSISCSLLLKLVLVHFDPCEMLDHHDTARWKRTRARRKKKQTEDEKATCL